MLGRKRRATRSAPLKLLTPEQFVDVLAGMVTVLPSKSSLAAAEFARYSVSCRHLGADGPPASDLDAFWEGTENSWGSA